MEFKFRSIFVVFAVISLAISESFSAIVLNNCKRSFLAAVDETQDSRGNNVRMWVRGPVMFFIKFVIVVSSSRIVSSDSPFIARFTKIGEDNETNEFAVSGSKFSSEILAKIGVSTLLIPYLDLWISW